ESAVNFALSQQSQERLKLLLELTNQVVSNLELRDLLRAASASLRRVMNSDVAGVMLPHPDGRQLQVYALDFPDGKGLLHEEALIPIDGSHPGEVFRTGKPMLKKQHEPAEEQSLDHHKRVAGEGMHAGCLLPLISRGRTLGILALGR